MIQLAQGTLASGIKFSLLVSEPVDSADLKNLGDLLHGGSIKVEETFAEEDRRAFNGEAK